MSKAPAAAQPPAPVAWPLPWLMDTWARLWAAVQADRMGHALLIAGPAGLGKRLLADRLTNALLCTAPAPDGSPCGHCEDCRLFATGNHPDSVHLTPEPGGRSREIKADQVRELCAQQALTTHRGRRKVLQIVPAEGMNTVAANGLLKTLEEPVASTLWLLVSEDPGRLAQTIRSRCQRITVPTPPEAQALPWLAARLAERARAAKVDPVLLLRLAHGAPLAALGLGDSEQLAAREVAFAGFVAVGQGQQDPLALADAWQRQEPSVVLDQLASWLCDLLRLQIDPQAVHLDNPDKRVQLAALAVGVVPLAAHRYLRRVFAAREVADATINKQLLCEALLVRWARLARGEDRDGP